MNYTILTMGNPELRSKSAVVNQFDESLHELASTMIEVMHASNGVGLAAPQIGIFKRVIVLEVNNNPRYPAAGTIPLTVLVNPEITHFSESTQTGWEGCLSVPGLRGLVPRAETIKWRANRLDGSQVQGDAEGFLARIIQHEIDHLDGILYPDRMPDLINFGYEENLQF